MARTKTNTKNNTKHEVDQDATDIQKTTILCFSDISIFFNFLNAVSKKC